METAPHMGKGEARARHELEDIDARLEAEPNNAVLHRARGYALFDCCVALSEPCCEQSILSFSRAIELDPKDSESHIGRGAVKGHLGRPAEALEDLERAVTLDSSSAQARFLRGMALDRLGRHDAALADFEHVIGTGCLPSMAHLGRGSLLLRLGRRDEALEEAKRSLSADPGSADALFLAARALSELERHEEALEHANRALALDQSRTDALMLKGFTLNRLGRREGQLEVCDALVAASPGRAEFHLLRAITLSCLDRNPEALAAFQRANELNPPTPMARQVGGIALFDTGFCEEALEMADHAASAGSEDAALHLLRAHMLLALGCHKGAVSACKRAIRLDPELVGAYEAMGKALLALGRATDSLQSFENALSLDDGLVGSHLGKAAALSAMGNDAAAKRSFERAVELDPKVAQIWDSLEARRDGGTGADTATPGQGAFGELRPLSWSGTAARQAGPSAPPGGQAPAQASLNIATGGAVCENGHDLEGAVREGEATDEPCPECGAGVLTGCPKCGRRLDGGVGGTEVGPSCPRCAEPFPWSAEARRAGRTAFLRILGAVAAGIAIISGAFYVSTFFG